jgi:hypothetical protein
MPSAAETHADRALAPPDMPTLACFVGLFPADAPERPLLRRGRRAGRRPVTATPVRLSQP